MPRSDRFDIVILGGGPAGCMAAIGAVLENPSLSVCVVDRNDVPQHRIGEALLTGTIIAMDQAGLTREIAAQNFHKKIGAAYRWGASPEPWYVEYPATTDPYPDEFRHANGRYAIHVPRHKFDRVLRDAAIRRGVTFIVAKAVNVRSAPTAEGPVVTAVEMEDGNVLRAGYFIDATGHNAVAARSLTKRESLHSPRIARYAYFSNVDWSRAKDAGYDPHRTNILAGPNGWMWVIHLGEAGDNLTSIGFVSTADILKTITFANAHEAFPQLADFGFGNGLTQPLSHIGAPVDAWYPHPDWSYRCAELNGRNWALVGDAAMFVDPILSQGVTLAVHYGLLRGKAAANWIATGNSGVQAAVSGHYLRESAVLRMVVGEWYAANRNADVWRDLTVDIAASNYGVTMDRDLAFRWITNLENLREEYDPFPADVRRHIQIKLAGDVTGGRIVA